jgi:hypothetical protein
MERLYEYIEARMPESGSKQKTVSCKFTVGCARMLIESEKRTFDLEEIDLWVKWLRKQCEGKIRDRALTATDWEYGIEAWRRWSNNT